MYYIRNGSDTICDILALQMMVSHNQDYYRVPCGVRRAWGEAWQPARRGRGGGGGRSGACRVKQGSRERTGGVWAHGPRSAIVGRPREKEDGSCPKE
jgi:hypothetical protein